MEEQKQLEHPTQDGISRKEAEKTDPSILKVLIDQLKEATDKSDYSDTFVFIQVLLNTGMTQKPMLTAAVLMQLPHMHLQLGKPDNTFPPKVPGVINYVASLCTGSMDYIMTIVEIYP